MKKTRLLLLLSLLCSWPTTAPWASAPLCELEVMRTVKPKETPQNLLQAKAWVLENLVRRNDLLFSTDFALKVIETAHQHLKKAQQETDTDLMQTYRRERLVRREIETEIANDILEEMKQSGFFEQVQDIARAQGNEPPELLHAALQSAIVDTLPSFLYIAQKYRVFETLYLAKTQNWSQDNQWILSWFKRFLREGSYKNTTADGFVEFLKLSLAFPALIFVSGLVANPAKLAEPSTWYLIAASGSWPTLIFVGVPAYKFLKNMSQNLPGRIKGQIGRWTQHFRLKRYRRQLARLARQFKEKGDWQQMLHHTSTVQEQLFQKIADLKIAQIPTTQLEPAQVQRSVKRIEEATQTLVELVTTFMTSSADLGATLRQIKSYGQGLKDLHQDNLQKRVQTLKLLRELVVEKTPRLLNLAEQSEASLKHIAIARQKSSELQSQLTSGQSISDQSTSGRWSADLKQNALHLDTLETTLQLQLDAIRTILDKLHLILQATDSASPKGSAQTLDELLNGLTQELEIYDPVDL